MSAASKSKSHRDWVQHSMRRRQKDTSFVRCYQESVLVLSFHVWNMLVKTPVVFFIMVRIDWLGQAVLTQCLRWFLVTWWLGLESPQRLPHLVFMAAHGGPSAETGVRTFTCRSLTAQWLSTRECLKRTRQKLLSPFTTWFQRFHGSTSTQITGLSRFKGREHSFQLPLVEMSRKYWHALNYQRLFSSKLSELLSHCYFSN